MRGFRREQTLKINNFYREHVFLEVFPRPRKSKPFQTLSPPEHGRSIVFHADRPGYIFLYIYVNYYACIYVYRYYQV